MVFEKDRLVEVLRTWASEVVRSPSCRIDKIYVFGSLIHPDGGRFITSTSDVDILAVMSGGASTWESRVKSCLALVDPKTELETKLLRALERDDASKPIASVVLASPEDMFFGLHKEVVPDFFNVNQFLPLTGTPSQPDSLPPSHPCESVGPRPKAAACRAQKERNKYLAYSTNGKNRLLEEPWDDTQDAVPKDLARIAAHVRYAIQNLKDGTHSDVNEGLEYLHKLVEALPADHLLKVWFRTRRAARGGRKPMSFQDSLALWELLADQSYQHLRAKSGLPTVIDEPSGSSPIVLGPPPLSGPPFQDLRGSGFIPSDEQRRHWQRIEARASSSFLQGYPLLMLTTAVEYAEFAQQLADQNVKYLLWTVNGSPLDVVEAGRWQRGNTLTNWDRVFKDRHCEKLRIIVFRTEEERTEYIDPRDEPRAARKEAFENACTDEKAHPDQLRFTSVDLLQQYVPSLASETRLDIGYVSWDTSLIRRSGICFYSPFASNDFASMRRAPVVVFETSTLPPPDSYNRDHQDAHALLKRLGAHRDLIEDIRTSGNLDQWLMPTPDSVPAMTIGLTAKVDEA